MLTTWFGISSANPGLRVAISSQNLKILRSDVEEELLLLPDSICPRRKVSRKTIAELINGHHANVVSLRSRSDKSLNFTPREPQKVTPFRMMIHLKNLELRLL
jgi:hypothetical protein